MLYFNINFIFFLNFLINASQPNYCYNFTTIMLQLFCFVQACICLVTLNECVCVHSEAVCAVCR